MYAIHVKEPGGETESYVLGTAARTPKSAVQLMFTRAEEFVEEQAEVDAEAAEDYIIEAHGELSVVVYDSASENHKVVIIFEAAPISEVV